MTGIAINYINNNDNQFNTSLRENKEVGGYINYSAKMAISLITELVISLV